MGAAVELRDHLMPLDSERGLELITDLARYAEGLVDEAAVKKMYRFSDEDWDRMGSNEELVEKIQADGSATDRRLLFLCAHIVRVPATNNGRSQYGNRAGFYGLQNRGIEASSI